MQKLTEQQKKDIRARIEGLQAVSIERIVRQLKNKEKRLFSELKTATDLLFSVKNEFFRGRISQATYSSFKDTTKEYRRDLDNQISKVQSEMKAEKEILDYFRMLSNAEILEKRAKDKKELNKELHVLQKKFPDFAIGFH